MKARRHEAILSIIREQPISTQDELAEALAARGIAVTQATVSRDIRELRLAKVAAGAGYRYSEPAELPAADAYGRARRAFSDFVVGMDRSGTLIVLKTTPGTANAVAAAIDEVSFANVVATLAGDDVVLIIAREPGEHEPPRPAIHDLEAQFRGLWGKEGE